MRRPLARLVSTRLCRPLSLGLALLALHLPADARAAPAAGAHGMVATAHPLASQAGIEILRAGGSAADAAAAAAFALSVVEPYSSGIGGGGFALVRHDGELVFLDFREVAPRAAHRDMFLRDGSPDSSLSRDGSLAVAVPGAVAGYVELHRRWGKLPRERVLAPAVRLASEGFDVTATYRAAAEWRLELLRRDPEASRIFLVPGAGGGPPEVPPLGHRIVQHDNAATLRAIAEGGGAPFYTGAIAAKLADDIQARGGIVSRDDLASYRVRTRTPLVGMFRGHAIATAPPPSAGGQVVLTILNVVESLPSGIGWHESHAIHLFVEASKRAFADRYLIGDPAFVDDLTPRLIAKDRGRLLAAVIGDTATPAAEVPPGQGAQLPPLPLRRLSPLPHEGADTSHLCVVDADGNAIALTTTVNYGWGSGIVARGTGVLLNDEMDDFAIAPGVANTYGIAGAEANVVQPGKIPLSSMSPTIVFAGPTTRSPVRMVVGSPGGPRIPTTVAQVITNHLALGADIAKAVALGRIHHQHLPDIVRVEPFTLDAATRRLLEKRGHVVEEGRPWSNATAIAIDPETGLRTGAADPRGIGRAVAE